MRHRYVAPSDSSAETHAAIDQMNALLDAADDRDTGPGEARALRRRAEAMGERLRARVASNAVQR